MDNDAMQEETLSARISRHATGMRALAETMADGDCCAQAVAARYEGTSGYIDGFAEESAHLETALADAERQRDEAGRILRYLYLRGERCYRPGGHMTFAEWLATLSQQTMRYTAASDAVLSEGASD